MSMDLSLGQRKALWTATFALTEVKSGPPPGANGEEDGRRGDLEEEGDGAGGGVRAGSSAGAKLNMMREGTLNLPVGVFIE